MDVDEGFIPLTLLDTSAWAFIESFEGKEQNLVYLLYAGITKLHSIEFWLFLMKYS